MKSFLYFLGFLWLLPISLLGFVLGLLLLALRQIEQVKWRSDFTVVWDLADYGWFFREAFYDRGWVGFSFGCHIFVKDMQEARLDRTLQHEARHCYQQYVLGIFFYPVYVLNSVWIWLFQRGKHSYYDNFFEVAARRAAGQPVKISKERWASGINDRWAWW